VCAMSSKSSRGRNCLSLELVFVCLRPTRERKIHCQTKSNSTGNERAYLPVEFKMQ
jgi:hypothetical protein